MAADFNCAYDDEPTPAVLLVTATATGETEAICAGCLPTWGLVMAGVEPNDIDEVLAKYVHHDGVGQLTPDESEPAAGGSSEGGESGDGAASPPAPVPILDAPLPDVVEPDRSSDGTAQNEAALASEEAQRADLHDKLAARPDAAKTSADVVDGPPF